MVDILLPAVAAIPLRAAAGVIRLLAVVATLHRVIAPVAVAPLTVAVAAAPATAAEAEVRRTPTTSTNIRATTRHLLIRPTFDTLGRGLFHRTARFLAQQLFAR